VKRRDPTHVIDVDGWGVDEVEADMRKQAELAREEGVLRKQAGPFGWLSNLADRVPGVKGTKSMMQGVGAKMIPRYNPERKFWEPGFTGPLNILQQQDPRVQAQQAEEASRQMTAERPEILAWELSNPEHENDLRSVQVNAWLQDMIANDEQIGSHSHQEVANAYNNLAKVAPRAMANPMIAKTTLANYMERSGNVGLYDPQGGIAQLIDVENKLKERDAYPRNVAPFFGPEMPEAEKFH